MTYQKVPKIKKKRKATPEELKVLMLALGFTDEEIEEYVTRGLIEEDGKA